MDSVAHSVLPPRIRSLPDLLVSQIAAGEVVERPASALKELIENSLDAGATQLNIALDNGGINLIRVADNGSGIPAEDLPLALARHATSKIASLDDLERVITLGFRGEALASMASVARLSIASRVAGERHGARIDCDGGTPGEIMPAALQRRTSILVRELEFHTPARRKFLKTEATEYAHCDEALRRAALAHAHVGFALAHNGRAQRRLPLASLAQRLPLLLGDDAAAGLIEMDQDGAGLRVHGFIGRPEAATGRRDCQYLFVNRP